MYLQFSTQCRLLPWFLQRARKDKYTVSKAYSTLKKGGRKRHDPLGGWREEAEGGKEKVKKQNLPFRPSSKILKAEVLINH